MSVAIEFINSYTIASMKTSTVIGGKLLFLKFNVADHRKQSVAWWKLLQLYHVLRNE